MGLIKAAKSAIGSTMHDQWKEAIRCENMTNDVLMVKKTTPTGVITNKSTIIVAPGQCAIIYDNGRVLDATAEEGIYTFDSSTSPRLDPVLYAMKLPPFLTSGTQYSASTGREATALAVTMSNASLTSGIWPASSALA